MIPTPCVDYFTCSELEASISYRAIQELLEADKGGNKWETLERCVQTQRNPKQMVVGICQEKIHERHRSLRSLL